MNKNILIQALVTMGYRQMDEKQLIWGKPIGFGMIAGEIKEEDNAIEFKTLFNNMNNELTVWDSTYTNFEQSQNGKVVKFDEIAEGKELYSMYVNFIAYAEYETNVSKIVFVGGHTQPFAFKTPNDVLVY